MAPLSLQEAFTVLGVTRETQQGVVRQTYRKLALQYHPDKNSDPSATAKFQQISAAYKRVSDDDEWEDIEDEDEDDNYDDDDLDDDEDFSFEEMLDMFHLLFGERDGVGRSRSSRRSAAPFGLPPFSFSMPPARRRPSARGDDGMWVCVQSVRLIFIFRF